MKVLNPANNLLEEFACLRFLKFLLLHNVVEQLSSTDIFHNEKELLGRLNNLEQLDDVGVSDEFEDVNFSSNSLYICFFRYFPFFQDLDCYLYIQRMISLLQN